MLTGPFNCSCDNCFSGRVLHAKSGKPIKSVPAFVETDQKLMIRLGETGGQGVVRFCPNDPVPASFTLEFKYVYQTDAEVHFDTEVPPTSPLLPVAGDAFCLDFPLYGTRLLV